VEVGGVEPPLDTFAFAAVVSYLITPIGRLFTYVCVALSPVVLDTTYTPN